MNSLSTLNLGLWGKIGTILDIFPKVIYLLYASVSSAVDALQALIRKLAGLDFYYQTVAGETNLVANTDPLTEFIYGILGFGDSAPVYQALNTVFWSFAIFGLIVLAVSTMAAIIKSHYNEDSAQTSPWKYLYTAGKAIVTFAIMPVVVILGLQITSFVLRTLDNITAGSGSEEEVRNLFGQNAANNILQSHTVTGTTESENSSGRASYTNYDFFGSGSASTTTTFSGMLFNAAAYNANRVRSEEYSISHSQTLIPGLLGASDSDFPTSGSDDEQKEYIANQVDYLFENNIYLVTSYSYSQLVSNSNDVAPVWSLTDWFHTSNSITSFSKFNTSLVWIFYNLWQFNFIVGFVGVLTIFAIMISIVLGMMTRLIKGAALFLIYPALLGLAPLDNFKAFKSWGSNFMQQLMMAFGAILGINLLMLILPYIQSITFFDIAVVDVIVQLIMLITGLLMAKDFIGLVNGFVGGADAMAAGEGAKGSIGGKLKAGIRPAANLAGGAIRVAGKGVKAVGNTAIAAGKTVAKSIAVGTAARRANKAAKERAENTQAAKEFASEFKKIVGALQSGQTIENVSKKKSQKYKEEIDQEGNAARKRGQAQGLTGEALDKYVSDAREQKAKEIAIKHNVGHKGDFWGTGGGTMGAKELEKESRARMRAADKAELKQKNITEKYKLAERADGKFVRTAETNKMQGKALLEIPKALGKGAADIGLAIGDGIVKTIKSAGDLLGLDKVLGGAKDILGPSLSLKGGKFEELGKTFKENKEKADATAKETKSASTQADILASSKAQREALSDIASSMKSLLKATENSESAQRATQKAVENMSRTLRNPPRGGNSGGNS